MKISTWKIEQVAGLLIGLLGLVVVIAWISMSTTVGSLIPGSAQMGLNTPMLFLAAGLCCVFAGSEVKRGSLIGVGLTACITLLLLLPALTLVEHIFSVSLGIDFVRVPTPPTPLRPTPGRMAPNSALGFLLAGTSFYLSRKATRTAREDSALTVATGGVILIAMAALAGYFLKLEPLYRFASYNAMVLPTAVGMSILGLALWFIRARLASHAQLPVENNGRRITSRAVVVLTVVALCAGVAGFVVMRDSFEQTMGETSLVTATTNATALANTLDLNLWFPRTIAARPAVRDPILKIERDASDAASRESLRKFGDSFLSAGLAGVQIFDAKGELLAASGEIVQKKATAFNALTVSGQTALLLWQEGYVLHAENDVLDAQRVIGKVVTEQRLPIFDALLTDVRKSNASSDILLCSRDKDDASCAPTRFYATPFRIPMFKADGSLNYPINHALVGQTGVMVVKDLRGIPVFAAYTPVKAYGLGLVVKANVETLYGPLKEKLNVLVAALVMLVLLGTMTLLLQVRPLLAQLVREQRRTKVILENSNDAFVALGSDGKITDWNSEAERTFGWSAAEAIGKGLAELIIPPAQRAAHRAGFQRFVSTGTGPVVNRRIEVTALCKDGREIPIELSVAAFHNGEGYLANAFMRDITDRKAAEKAIADSEKRLLAITDNLPVLISYIDKDHRFQFTNGTFKKWMGMAPPQMFNRHLEDVIGTPLYDQRRGNLERALGGERIDFEVTSEARGVIKHLQTTYIPDRLADGTIAGVYTISNDVTALKEVEKQLTMLARFDTLTGLPNRHQLNEKLEEIVHRSRRLSAPMAVMFLDIDHFKRINDSLGHAAGDAVLVEFAKRLKSCVRLTDTVARLSGDEFVIVLEGLHSPDEPQFVARKIIAAVGKEWSWEGRQLQISTSIGIAFNRAEVLTPTELMAIADAALYGAKEDGRNTFKIESR
ncbi:hypothetical protein BH11PSE11_BH11PSE11_29860 [soil metagenome]